MPYKGAPPVCSQSSDWSTGEYPAKLAQYLPQFRGGSETLVGFTAITSPCKIHGTSGQHVQIDGWNIVTTKALYWIDNDAVVYRARFLHPFTDTEEG